MSGAVRTAAPGARSTLGGIALVVAACACFSASDTASKFAGTSVPVLMALRA